MFCGFLDSPAKPATFAAFYPAFTQRWKPQTNVPLFKLNCIHAATKSIAIYFVIRKQACDWSFSRAANIGYFMQPATQTDTTSTCTISDDFIKIYFVAFFTSFTDPISFLINQIVITMITIWYPCRSLLCTRKFKSLLTLINSDNWI